MRRLLLNTILFLLPILAVLAPPFIVMWKAGEFLSLNQTAALMEGSRPILVGSAYSNYRRELQLLEAGRRDADVLALGSSRVGELHSAFFADPGVFYNATGGARTIYQFRYFLSRLGEKTPKLLIVSMEPYYFNASDIKNADLSDPFATSSRPYDLFLESFFRNGGWWKLYRDVWQGKVSPTHVFERNDSDILLIGLRTVGTSDGFTNDGSDHYGSILVDEAYRAIVMEQMQQHANNVAARGYEEYGYDPAGPHDAQGLDELRNFLAFCKEKGIDVIGFVPPMSHGIYAQLAAQKDAVYADRFETLPKTLGGIFREFDFELYDFQDPASFGSSDEEMANPTHGSQKMYVRLFIKMAERSKLLKPYVDLPALQKALAASQNNYEVFPLSLASTTK